MKDIKVIGADQASGLVVIEARDEYFIFLWIDNRVDLVGRCNKKTDIKNDVGSDAEKDLVWEVHRVAAEIFKGSNCDNIAEGEQLPLDFLQQKNPE